LEDFYAACAEAGSDACALHESSASAVKARVEGIFAALKKRPLAVPAVNDTIGMSTNYGLVDYAAARRVVFQWLYKPYTAAHKVAAALAATEAGDGRPLWELSRSALLDYHCECGSKRPGDDISGGRNQVGRELTLAIACSDGDVVEDSLDELQEHYEGMAKDSAFAEMWSMRLMCSCVFRVAAESRGRCSSRRQRLEDPV
jgi:hypothetical protein